jgi:cytochrome b6-f complex iron-sulfur subunit
LSDITRRDFIKIVNRILVVTGVGILVSPIIAFFYPSNLQDIPAEPIMVGKVEELPENEARVIKYGRYPTIVLNTSQGLKAYSAVCTHFACIVKWNKEINQFACPCHAGFYDPLDGHVISGPPPRPLTSFPVTVVEGVIYVGEKV